MSTDINVGDAAVYAGTSVSLQYRAAPSSGLAEVSGTNRIVINSTGIGFFATTPAARPSAYTQTYSTANKTVAAPTAATLTDNTAGTANTTLQALADGTTYANDVAAIRNNFADLAAQVNALIADDLDNRQTITAIIDDLQALGLFQ